MKDLFSRDSDRYARYRPAYPEACFRFLLEKVPARQAAWDCGTGNGQVACTLARYFEKVFATDISQAQLDQAVRMPNIHYSVQPAEQTDFPDHCFDLVIAAQAVHWFDFDRFYTEVRRTGKPGGLICILGYARMRISRELDEVVDSFYRDTIGPFWDPERMYIDEDYATIPFPFEELDTPALQQQLLWTPEHVEGYLRTWSAVKHYETARGHNPVDAFLPGLKKAWGNQPFRQVRFPILMRAGRI